VKQRNYERENQDAARRVLELAAAGDQTQAPLIQWARKVLHHAEPQPAPRCTIVRAETCCACGLLADPAHRPAGSDEFFCWHCCPACRAPDPSQAELFGEEAKRT
jgi:hypothetical protein